MLRNLISKKATILIIQVLALISLLIGQLPITALADSTPATKADVPTLIANIPPKKQQATLHDGLISSPRAQDPKYKITTNLGAFKQSPNLQAVTINLQAQGLVKAQTQLHFQISDYAVNFDQKQLQLPAGITAQKIGTGHLILTVHRDLRISKQRSLEISLPVKAVTGNYPLYFAIEYGHSPVRLKATSLGILSLGGTLAHFKPQQQMHQLAHALKQDQTPKAQAATREKERKAQPIQVHHSVATKSGAKQLIDNQQATASLKAGTQIPDLRQPPYENNNVFNSNINQRALETKVEINNSWQGIKIHAENTQTHQLVGKLNDASISMQDVTPEFEAYYDANGENNPISKPAATVRVDNSGNGTLAVKNTGWYILHQTNNYPASSGWTYLIKNTDGTYTHDEDGNYYAVYYDANENKVTQFMSCGTRQLLPVYAPDVKELFNKRATSSSYSDWRDALQYINQNGGEVTFYGNGDLSNKLPKIDSGACYAYDDYWNWGSWLESNPENQRYKYGRWLIGAMRYYDCLNHPLPQGIDTYKTPLPLSTKLPSLQNTDNGPSTSYDTTLKVNNNLVTLGDRKIQRVNIDTRGVNIDTQGRMTSSFIKNSQYNVFYAGPTGHGIAEGSFEVKLLKQADIVNSLTGKLYLSNFNQDGWYILQQKDLAGNGTSHQVNGSYYALKYSVLDGITEYFRVSQKFGDQVPLPPVVSDVKELFNKRATSSSYSDWRDALQYINQNGGEVTFYGNGDLSNKLPKIDSGACYAYDDYWNWGSWLESNPENQRYKYGRWLIGAMRYYDCLNHPLPQGIDTYKTPLPLSTKSQEYLDLSPETDAYTQGLTTADDFLTGKNGTLYFRDKFIGIQKVDQDNNQKTLKGATFKAFYSGEKGVSNPNSNVSVSESTDKNGITKIPITNNGWYIIQEQKPPEGYSQNTSYYALKIDTTYGIIAMMTGYSSQGQLKPVYDNKSKKSNYGPEVELKPGTVAYSDACTTNDGFLIAQKGHLIFQDKFIGLAKVNYYDETLPVSNAEFYLWYAGLNGDGSGKDKQLPVVDNQGLIPEDSGYKAKQNIYRTQKSGLLQLKLKKAGWYILEEGQPPTGYKNHSNFYYSFHWSPGGGVDQILKGNEQQLLPPVVSDVKELFNKRATSSYSDWRDALQYINQNGGEVTFYGNGDLSNKLPKIDSGAYYAYDDYWNWGSWLESNPENQRYKYGRWLIGAMRYYDCLNHPLPQGIDTYKTPLPLSTLKHNAVKLPHTDKNDYNSPYRKGVTTNDGFLTAKNGSLYMRNIPATYLTLDNNQLVVKRSALQNGGAVWKGLWHDIDCLPTNDKKASVSLSVDGRNFEQITKPSKADKTGTDEFGQHDFQVTFKDDSSQPRPLSESKGEAGLATNNGNSLGEHDLAFQAHGTADSSVIKKKIIVVSDDYPYKVKINKDFTVNDSQQHYKKAILSDCKSRIGDQVTVYTKIKNLGNSLYNGKLTTTIPEQFMYKEPDSKCINIIADNGSTISAPIKFDGQTLTVSLPKELEKNVQYQLSYKMEQIAPMPLSYPGPSGGASAIDHLNADSRDAQYPFYGANSNLVQWFSDQALWVSLVHYPSLEFGEQLLIKDYVGMHLNNTADPSQNYFKVHDTGYLGSNTWQLTAQMSQWARSNSKKSEDNLPGSEILYQDRPTRPCFSKTISPGGPPTLLLERGSGKKFSSPDITQPLKIVQLNVGNRNPQAGKYHSTVTYTLTQSLE